MSKRAVDAVFQAMFLLTELRVMLRETAPLHDFDAEQKEEAALILGKIKKQVDILESEVLG